MPKHLPYLIFLLIVAFVGGYLFLHQQIPAASSEHAVKSGSGILLIGEEYPLLAMDLFINPDQEASKTALDSTVRLVRDDFPGKLEIAIHLLPKTEQGKRIASATYSRAEKLRSGIIPDWFQNLQKVVGPLNKESEKILSEINRKMQNRNENVDLPAILETESSIVEEKNIDQTPLLVIDDSSIDMTKEYTKVKSIIGVFVENKERKLVEDGKGKKEHKHVNFKVYINGQALDFSQEKYQSTKDHPLNPDVHLHDGNGGLIHFHREKITLAMFFESLGIKYDGMNLDVGTGVGYENYRLVLDSGELHHIDPHVSMVINGKRIEENLSGDYIPQDLDRILISVHGDVWKDAEIDTLLQEQFKTVGDDACIYSLKCPERGTPPPESCSNAADGGCS